MASEAKPRVVRARFDIDISPHKKASVAEGFEHRTGYMVGGHLGVDRRDDASPSDRWVVTDLWSGMRIGRSYRNFRTRREALEMCAAILPAYEAHDRESDAFKEALGVALREWISGERGAK